jgi:hypothetical protein
VPDIYGYYKSNGIGHARGHLECAQEVAQQAAPQRTKAAFHPVRRLKQVLVRDVDGNVTLQRCERVQHELGLQSRPRAVLD